MAEPTASDGQAMDGGPWWGRLGTTGIAVLGLVYLGETLGGRFLDILRDDLQAQRETQQRLVEVLGRTAIATEEVRRLYDQQLEVDRERNRILITIRDDLQDRTK